MSVEGKSDCGGGWGDPWWEGFELEGYDDGEGRGRGADTPK